jgi:16S rRNA (guanine966-N2)-methyltransferase
MAAIGGSLEDAVVLDLFSGSGALGLEALSRGARTVVFVERSRGALQTLRANIELLGAEAEGTVVPGDAMAYVKRLEEAEFDLALADPPYGQGWARELLEVFQVKGFAHELWVEHRSDEAMPSFPELRQRRYGDTTISILKRDE